MRDEGDFNMQQMDDEIDIAMNEAFDNAAMDSGNLVKLDKSFRIFIQSITKYDRKLYDPNFYHQLSFVQVDKLQLKCKWKMFATIDQKLFYNRNQE